MIRFEKSGLVPISFNVPALSVIDHLGQLRISAQFLDNDGSILVFNIDDVAVHVNRHGRRNTQGISMTLHRQNQTCFSTTRYTDMINLSAPLARSGCVFASINGATERNTRIAETNMEKSRRLFRGLC